MPAQAPGVVKPIANPDFATALGQCYDMLLRDIGLELELRGDGMGPDEAARLAAAAMAPENRPMVAGWWRPIRARWNRATRANSPRRYCHARRRHGGVGRRTRRAITLRALVAHGIAHRGVYREGNVMFTPIRGKSVIVTGGSKGIGKGIASVFAKQGARVLVVARGLETAQATVRKIAAIGGTASAFQADVAKWEDMEAMADAAVERHGGIDILCANAGVFPDAKMRDMTAEQWDEVLGTNLKGCFLSIKACMAHLGASGAGRIILTSSITGPLTGFPGWTHYGASKSGQLGFMRTAAIELAGDGITINAVLPGNIKTEGLIELGEEYLATMASSIPLKRLGVVEDIGNAALFFASKEAAFITGQTIVVDGGQTLPESLEAVQAA